MRFSQLDNKARDVAINDYRKGWKETHPDETLSYMVAEDCCLDTEDDVTYNKLGVVDE